MYQFPAAKIPEVTMQLAFARAVNSIQEILLDSSCDFGSANKLITFNRIAFRVIGDSHF